MIGEFHFLRPFWLLALPFLLWIGWLLARRPAARNPWVGVVDAHLLRHLGLGAGDKGKRSPVAFFLPLGWTLALLALAGPTWEKAPPVKFHSQLPPLVVALDLSRSMDAVDLHPSRLAVAKVRLAEFLERLGPRPVGLVVFAGHAHQVMPPTEDVGVLLAVLPHMETALMPIPGSDPAVGLEHAHALGARGGAGEVEILLITDGARGVDEALSTVIGIRERGGRISVLGVGTDAGGPIRAEAGSSLMHQGAPVTVGFDAAGLEGLAQAGGGLFVRAQGGDIERLLPPSGFQLKEGEEAEEEQGTVWLDRGPWLLLALLPLAAIAFRRGWLGAVLLLLALGGAPPAQAFDLWRNADQLGLQALGEGRPGEAAGLFRDPFWRAVALYRDRDYQGAANLFAGLSGPKAHFNRGNALVHLGRLEEAMDAYAEALRLDPMMDAAAGNLELIRSVRAGDQDAPKPRPPSMVEAAPAEPASDEVPPHAQEYLAKKGGDRLLADMEGERERHGLDAEMSSGQILSEGAADAEGREGAGTGQGAGGGLDMDASGIARPGENPLDAETTAERSEADHDFSDPVEAGDRARSAADLPRSRQAPSKGQGVGDGEGGETTRAASGGDPDPAAGEQPVGGQPQWHDEGEAEIPDPATTPPPQGDPRDPEIRQAMQQWLERIPDNPGGLLKEKFRREAERAGATTRGVPW